MNDSAHAGLPRRVTAVAGYGIGAYTIPEASRLLGVPARTLLRWVRGYGYDHHGPETRQPPVWTAQYDVEDEDGVLLGFRDLIEARVVDALRRRRISLPYIRQCLARAAEIVGSDHPFSTTMFKSDGRRIFVEITGDGAAPELVDLGDRQQVFRSFVARTFLDLDFGADAADRWWPDRKRAVVIDPAYAFGQPTVAGRGLKTQVVAQAVAAEGSVERVARLYELPVKAVRDAVAFERGSALKLAA